LEIPFVPPRFSGQASREQRRGSARPLIGPCPFIDFSGEQVGQKDLLSKHISYYKVDGNIYYSNCQCKKQLLRNSPREKVVRFMQKATDACKKQPTPGASLGLRALRWAYGRFAGLTVVEFAQIRSVQCLLTPKSRRLRLREAVLIGFEVSPPSSSVPLCENSENRKIFNLTQKSAIISTFLLTDFYQRIKKSIIR
jgi:hypothetical protein